MSAQPITTISVAEYLAFERNQLEKHEYLQHMVVLQAGASINHNLITANLIGSLHQQLRGKPCMALPSDLRVSAPDHLHYMYPDVTVLCGSPIFDDKTQDTVINPVLIIEVLSKSTELYDRGIKFQAYRTIPMLQEYILVDQFSIHIEHFKRQNEVMWLMTEYTTLDQIVELSSVSCTISVADVYEKVIFGLDHQGIE